MGDSWWCLGLTSSSAQGSLQVMVLRGPCGTGNRIVLATWKAGVLNTVLSLSPLLFHVVVVVIFNAVPFLGVLGGYSPLCA